MKLILILSTLAASAFAADVWVIFAGPDPLDLSNRSTDLHPACRWHLRSVPEELEHRWSVALRIGQYTHYTH